MPGFDETNRLLPFNQPDAPPLDSQEGNDLPLIGPHISLPPPSPRSKHRPRTSKNAIHTTRGQVVFLLIKSSAIWVTPGIGTMVIGIGIVQAILLPKIHACPANALCPGSFNPNATNVLQLLQATAVMCVFQIQ